MKLPQWTGMEVLRQYKRSFAGDTKYPYDMHVRVLHQHSNNFDQHFYLQVSVAFNLKMLTVAGYKYGSFIFQPNQIICNFVLRWSSFIGDSKLRLYQTSMLIRLICKRGIPS